MKNVVNYLTTTVMWLPCACVLVESVLTKILGN